MRRTGQTSLPQPTNKVELYKPLKLAPCLVQTRWGFLWRDGGRQTTDDQSLQRQEC
jgi:hypothetical protein